MAGEAISGPGPPSLLSSRSLCLTRTIPDPSRIVAISNTGLNGASGLIATIRFLFLRLYVNCVKHRHQNATALLVRGARPQLRQLLDQLSCLGGRVGLRHDQRLKIRLDSPCFCLRYSSSL